jgi:hypothetical protein
MGFTEGHGAREFRGRDSFGNINAARHAILRDISQDFSVEP